jgi:hypothetical protein
MKRLLHFLFALAVAAPAIAAEVTPAMIRRTNARIEQLLGPRLNPPAAPANLANPFVLPDVIQAPASVESSAAPTDSETLKRLQGVLKVNGLVEIQGKLHLIINRLPYREGDLVAVKEASGTTYLRLKKITPRTYVLELNGKEYQSSLNPR